jgi:hypothetical protein
MAIIEALRVHQVVIGEGEGLVYCVPAEASSTPAGETDAHHKVVMLAGPGLEPLVACTMAAATIIRLRVSPLFSPFSTSLRHWQVDTYLSRDEIYAILLNLIRVIHNLHVYSLRLHTAEEA